MLYKYVRKDEVKKNFECQGPIVKLDRWDNYYGTEGVTIFNISNTSYLGWFNSHKQMVVFGTPISW